MQKVIELESLYVIYKSWTTSRYLQSAHEDRETHLGNYVMGIGEIEAFSERLKRELLANGSNMILK